MVMHVLVAFATKHGSTGEIAAAIGSTLRNAGLEADVRSARDVATIAPYESSSAARSIPPTGNAMPTAW